MFYNPIRFTVALALALAIPCFNVEAVEFVVAPNGNDANPGTREKPLASLAAAQQKVRGVLKTSKDQHITVTLRSGEYRISAPLVFGPEDGGDAKRSVTYRGADGERAVITGGRRIGGWRAEADGTWRTVIKDVKEGRWRFRELYINGQRRPRAGHPNAGWVRAVKSLPDRRTGFSFKPADIPVDAYHPQLELVFLHDWSISRIPVAEIDHAKKILRVTAPIGCRAAHYAIDHFEKHPRYRLENAPTLLDAPGEWFLDRKTGDLTYKPKPGEDLKTVNAVAPFATTLLQAKGKPDQPLRNLHFRNLHFQHCAWLLPKGGYASGQASYHERRDGSGGNELRQLLAPAVEFEIARQCSITQSTFTRMGGSAVRFGGRCSDCRFEHNLISDVSANGLMIGEDSVRRVRKGKRSDTWWKVAPEQVASNNHVTRNIIERCGAQFYGGVAVWVGLAEKTRITHNIIRHHPYTGVSVGWMWNPTPTPCKQNTISYNHIHHVMQLLSDGGGIYTLGRQPGSVLSGNVIHDVPLNAGRAESNGMFLDEGTTDSVIEGNVIYDIDRSPLRFHRATVNLVKSNVLVVKKKMAAIRYNSTNPKDSRRGA